MKGIGDRREGKGGTGKGKRGKRNNKPGAFSADSTRGRLRQGCEGCMT